MNEPIEVKFSPFWSEYMVMEGSIVRARFSQKEDADAKAKELENGKE